MLIGLSISLLVQDYLRINTISILVLQSLSTVAYSALVRANQRTLVNKKLFIPSSVKSPTVFMNLVTIASPRCEICKPNIPLHHHSAYLNQCLFYFDHYCEFLQVKVYAGTQLRFIMFLLFKILELTAGISIVFAQLLTNVFSHARQSGISQYKFAQYILARPMQAVILSCCVLI